MLGDVPDVFVVTVLRTYSVHPDDDGLFLTDGEVETTFFSCRFRAINFLNSYDKDRFITNLSNYSYWTESQFD